jgi:hypothetical protein
MKPRPCGDEQETDLAMSIHAQQRRAKTEKCKERKGNAICNVT